MKLNFATRWGGMLAAAAKRALSSRLYKSADLAELYSLFRRYIKLGGSLLSRFLPMWNIEM
jgi:hypothetical protein